MIRTTNATRLALGMEDRTPTNECGWLLEAEKGKGTGSPLEPPEGISPYTDFRSEVQISKTKKLILFVVLSH